jgi:aspartyl aminopeptidase
VTALARVARPFCRVSNVAIHLNRAVNEDGLRLDKGRHLAPMAALLDAGEDPQRAALEAVAEAVGCEPDAVRGFDLCAYDVMPAAFLGREGEFIASARLDNLASCHAGLAAVLAEPSERSAAPEATAVALLFDHEEVGSATAEGAASAWTAGLVERICEASGGAEGRRAAIARSLVVSADMAHAVHPNQPEKHDGVHAPRLNGGPVVKTNASRRYGTDSETGAFFRALCRAEGVAAQEFVSRADMGCGSTIGPIVATGLGVRTVDVGNPMLSMHSARELAGRHDVAPMARVLTRFLAGRDPLPW